MKSLSDILTGPDKWTKNAPAVNAADEAVLPYSDTACKFCLGGAVSRLNFRKSSWGDGTDYMRTRLVRAVRKLFPDRLGIPNNVVAIEAFNDHPDTTFEDVKMVIADSGC